MRIPPTKTRSEKEGGKVGRTGGTENVDSRDTWREGSELPLNEQIQASINFEAVLYLGYLCYCSHSCSNIND